MISNEGNERLEGYLDQALKIAGVERRAIAPLNEITRQSIARRSSASLSSRPWPICRRWDHTSNNSRYIGRVGTGFSHEVLKELRGKLIKLKTAKSPFGKTTKGQAVTTWVKPQLVAELDSRNGQAPARCVILFI
jgi:hypothetical protein